MEASKRGRVLYQDWGAKTCYPTQQMGSIYLWIILMTMSKSHNFEMLKLERVSDFPTSHFINGELRPRTGGDLPEVRQQLLEVMLGAGGLLQG